MNSGKVGGENVQGWGRVVPEWGIKAQIIGPVANLAHIMFRNSAIRRRALRSATSLAPPRELAQPAHVRPNIHHSGEGDARIRPLSCGCFAANLKLVISD
jgi:hypothetical protein